MDIKGRGYMLITSGSLLVNGCIMIENLEGREENFSLVWFLDQYQYLGNCPPTPPLTQQQSIDNRLELMLG